MRKVSLARGFDRRKSSVGKALKNGKNGSIQMITKNEIFIFRTATERCQNEIGMPWEWNWPEIFSRGHIGRKSSRLPRRRWWKHPFIFDTGRFTVSYDILLDFFQKIIFGSNKIFHQLSNFFFMLCFYNLFNIIYII